MPATQAALRIRERVGPTPRGMVVVAMGDCAGCISFDFAAWARLLAGRRIPLIGLADASPAAIRTFVAELPAGVMAVPDPKSETLGALNAIWAGRAFYFDQGLRLRWRTSMQQGMQGGADLRAFREYLDARQ